MTLAYKYMYPIITPYLIRVSQAYASQPNVRDTVTAFDKSNTYIAGKAQLEILSGRATQSAETVTDRECFFFQVFIYLFILVSAQCTTKYDSSPQVLTHTYISQMKQNRRVAVFRLDRAQE